jgi:hypothetical protein
MELVLQEWTWTILWPYAVLTSVLGFGFAARLNQAPVLLCFIVISAFTVSFPLRTEAAEKQAPNKIDWYYLRPDFGSASRIQYLKTTIGIKSGQSRSWSDYVAALQTFRQAVRARREEEVMRLLGESITVSEGSFPRERQNQLDAAKTDLKAKFDALYAVLDSSQRLMADAILTKGECGR